MTNKPFNILFLCTGNSARSVMAEALMSTLGNGRFKAFSAGSHPTGHVNPLAIEMIESTNYPIANLRSKSWDEFAAPGSPVMDFVVTVCDNAAGEVCPIWPGHPITAHWGFEDPAAIGGTQEEKRRAFRRIFLEIQRRVQLFANLPFATLDNMAIKREMDKLGDLSRVPKAAS